MNTELLSEKNMAWFRFKPVPSHEFCHSALKVGEVVVFDHDNLITEVRVDDEKSYTYFTTRFSTGCVFVAYERPA